MKYKLLFTYCKILLTVLVVSLYSCNLSKYSITKMGEVESRDLFNSNDLALIHPLYLEDKAIQLKFPNDNLGSLVSEQVIYINPDNQTDLFKNDSLDSQKTYNLNEVVVEAKSKFTPERNGKINVNFLVDVPKELLNENWGVYLQPLVIMNDSILKLNRIILKGNEFAKIQQKNYQLYDDYVKSIVPRDLYNSTFINHDKLKYDIMKEQNSHYVDYHKHWKLRKEYEQWAFEQKSKNDKKKIMLEVELLQLQNKYKHKLIRETKNKTAIGIDTTGLAKKYDSELSRKSEFYEREIERLDELAQRIPKKYQEVYELGIRARDMGNTTMSSIDSVMLAENRFDLKYMLENESKIERMEEIKEQMIPFPYDKEARIDTLINTKERFNYLYVEDLPIMHGLNNIKIALDAKIVGHDESSFSLAYSDTLTFSISSLVQLVDTMLLHNEKTIKRDVATKTTIYPKYKANSTKFVANYKDNTQQLAELLDVFKSYENSNTFDIDSVLIQAATSLDGDYQKNAELSAKRVEELEKHLSKSSNMGIVPIKTNYIGEDWNLLARLIKSNSSLANKDAILELLGTATNPDETKKEIKEMYVEDYKIIQSSIFPQLDRLDVLFYAHRKGMTEDSEIVKVDSEYIEGVRLLQNREYEAVEFLTLFGQRVKG